MQHNMKTWQDVLRLCVKKFDYELAMSSYVAEGFFRRIALAVAGRRPVDPAPEWNSEQLAGEYVRLYNQTKGFGRRIELDNDRTIHTVLRYQVEDRMPVLTVTYYEDGTAYVEKKRIHRDGGIQNMPVPYPVSEFGILGLPDRGDVRELAKAKESLPGLIDELRKAVVEAGDRRRLDK